MQKYDNNRDGDIHDTARGMVALVRQTGQPCETEFNSFRLIATSETTERDIVHQLDEGFRKLHEECDRKEKEKAAKQKQDARLAAAVREAAAAHVIDPDRLAEWIASPKGLSQLISHLRKLPRKSLTDFERTLLAEFDALRAPAGEEAP